MKTGHRLNAALVGLAVVAGLGADSAQAALPGYLSLNGQVQGNIQGSVTRAGRVDTIEVLEVHHLLRRDPGPGTIVHEPFIFLKAIDQSTDNLYRAFATNETLTAVFRFYRTSQQGQEVNHYTVTLTNASIVAIEPITRDVQDPASSSILDRERVRMTYASIFIEWTNGNQTWQIDVN